jgi:prepilin-type N-terminal cleavage/methylation domain-containing protein
MSQRVHAFTLSELLVALAILGVVAIFALPKVLQSQQNSQRVAVFKETIAALATITEEAARTRAMQSESTASFFNSRLNYVKVCTTSPTAEGCWASPPIGNNPNAYVLHSGAAVSSFNAGIGASYETVGIDWNGVLPPNVEGDDILVVLTCFGPANCPTMLGSGPKVPGTVGPLTAGSVTFYEQIFE